MSSDTSLAIVRTDAAPSAEKILFVVFRVADAEYLMAASDVLQMDSYQGATPVPQTAPYVVGIVQTRGQIVPVIDLRVRFGLGPTPVQLDSRIVVGQSGNRRVALLVDVAREVIKVDADDLRPPPAMVSEEADGLVKAVVHVGARMLLLIDFPKVIGEERVDVE